MKIIKYEKWYLAIVATLGFISWSLGFWLNSNVEIVTIVNITTYALAILAIAFLLILNFDFNYSIPIVLTYLFSISLPRITLEDIGYTIILYLGLLIVLAAVIYRLVKSKTKLKLNALGLGFLLAGFSIFIPFFYTGLGWDNLSISSLGFIYLFFYLIYSNLIKENRPNFLFSTLFSVSLILLLQLVSQYTYRMSLHPEVFWYDRLVQLMISGWGGNHFPLWGNINDLTIHVVLFSSTVLYYLITKPNRLWPWLYALLIWFLVFISMARGSIITLLILLIMISIYVIRKRKEEPKLFRNYLYTVLIFIVIVISLSDAMAVVFGMLKRDLPSLLDFENWNQILSGRINIYKQAISVWLKNPLNFFLGQGWMDKFALQNEYDRIIVYHSTFFHVLATGGLVGIGILIFHFYQVYKLFKNSIVKNASTAFLITYLLTQFHGLLDNTQYMMYYTISTILIFSVIENKANLDQGIILELN